MVDHQTKDLSSLLSNYCDSNDDNVDNIHNFTSLINLKESSRYGMVLYNIRNFPGIKVSYVDNTLSAYRDGVRAGDIILAINSKPFFNLQQFHSLLKSEFIDGNLSMVTCKRFVIHIHSLKNSFVKHEWGYIALHDCAQLKKNDIVVSCNGKTHPDQLLVDLRRLGSYINYTIPHFKNHYTPSNTAEIVYYSNFIR
tara:strand:- start:248 stop:835 length:588 start_codon:yes stop_codon:yes gene_type:complete